MTPHPQIVITGARVWTGDASPGGQIAGRDAGEIPGRDAGETEDAGPDAEAIAVLDDRILAVGGLDEVLALAGPATERMHLPGRLVIPGFQDAHVHPPFAGRYRMHLSLH